MNRLVKIVILLAIVVAGIALAVRYAGQSGSDKTAITGESGEASKQAGKATVPQPQEKYGFAPVDE